MEMTTAIVVILTIAVIGWFIGERLFDWMLDRFRVLTALWPAYTKKRAR